MERYRETVYDTVYQDGYTTYQTDSSYSRTDYADSFILSAGSKRVWDHVTPNFFQKKKRGAWLPLNPFRLYENNYKLKSPEASVFVSATLPKKTSTYVVENYYAKYPGPLTGHVYGDLSPLEDVSNTLALKVTAKAKQSYWDFLTFMGELRKSIDFVTNAYSRTVANVQSTNTRIDRIMRGTRRSTANRRLSVVNMLLDQQSEFWLEARFALRPILFDLQNIADELDRTRRKLALHRERLSEVAEIREDYVKTFPGYKIIGTAVLRHTRTVQVGGAWDLMLSTKLPDTNLVQTAWELLPYSWLVDRILNTADIVTALSFTPNVVNRGLWRTTTSTTELVRQYYHVEITDPNRWLYGVTTPCTQDMEYVSKIRDPYLADLQYLPSFTGQSWNWAQILDVVALGKLKLSLLDRKLGAIAGGGPGSIPQYLRI